MLINRFGLGVAAAVAAFLVGCDWLKEKKEQSEAKQQPKTPNMEPANCKGGYCEISKGPFEGKKIAFKQTPVTNAEWAELTESLGQDRFILLDWDSSTFKARVVKTRKRGERATAGRF